MSQFRLEVFVQKDFLGEIMEYLLKNNPNGVHLSGCDLVELPKKAEIKSLPKASTKILTKKRKTVLPQARPFFHELIQKQMEPFRISYLKPKLLEAFPEMQESSFWFLVREARNQNRIVKQSDGRYRKVD